MAIPSEKYPWPYALLRLGRAPSREWQLARRAHLKRLGYASLGVQMHHLTTGFPLQVGEHTDQNFRITRAEKPTPTNPMCGWGPMEQWLPDHALQRVRANLAPGIELIHWFTPPLTHDERAMADVVFRLHGERKKLWDLFAVYARARGLPCRDLEPGSDW